MSWIDRLGNRRGDDEDYDSVEAELDAASRPPKYVYCPECHKPMLPGGKCDHVVDWNERSGR